MKKFASMIVALLCPLFLMLAAAPAVYAQTESPADKATKRTYEVNEEHIARQAAEKAQPSILVSYIKMNLSDDSLLHRFYFLLYMLMPFAILGISLWIEFSGGWGDNRKLFMLGLSEFVFGVGNAGMGAGVYPWFCDFDIVGWIVTIICFCYMLRLLIKQAGVFLGFVNGRSGGELTKKVLYILIYFGVAVTMTMLLSAKPYFWLAPIVVGAAWYYLYRNVYYGDGAATTRMLVNTGVIFGGFIIFFLQVIGLILLVALALFLLKGFASIKTSPLADESMASSQGGMLERSADGTPFIRNNDGTTTQLRDRGDGVFEDFNGNVFKDNGSGFLFR